MMKMNIVANRFSRTVTDCWGKASFTDWRFKPSEWQTKASPNHDLTEAKIIGMWSDGIEEFLTGEYRASDLPIARKHYEQFGRIMLEIFRICHDKKGFENSIPPKLLPLIPDAGFADIIADGPASTEDRIMYRVYLSMIGHPDFTMHHGVYHLERDVYQYWFFVISLISMFIDRKLSYGIES